TAKGSYTTLVWGEMLLGAITNGAEWDWPTAPSMEWMEVKNATPGDFKPNPMRDNFLQWGGDPSGRFSVKSAWESIRSSSFSKGFLLKVL
ncbi:unnamed protein product, partial [Ilex paraguariensis]